MKKWIYNALIVLFAAVFLISAGALGLYYWDAYRQASRYDQLTSLMPTPERPVPTQQAETSVDPTAPEPPAPEMVTVTDPATGFQRQVLSVFGQIYPQNGHIVGWLKIPGTKVDYPVMQTPDDPEYYLQRDFDKKRSSRGCLFAQADADVFAPSDNVVIYGHNMRDGSMFGQLKKYESAAFCRENPYIYFDTLEKLQTYQIVAVFRTSASAGQGLAYHAFVDGDEETFESFIAQIKDIALYDTGVDAQYGDKLICLSTCEYTLINGRLVVVAKRIAG